MTAAVVALMLLLTVPLPSSGIGACRGLLGGETIDVERGLPPHPHVLERVGDLRALVAELVRRQLVVQVPIDWRALPDRSASAATVPSNPCAPLHSN